MTKKDIEKIAEKIEEIADCMRDVISIRIDCWGLKDIHIDRISFKKLYGYGDGTDGSFIYKMIGGVRVITVM